MGRLRIGQTIKIVLLDADVLFLEQLSKARQERRGETARKIIHESIRLLKGGLFTIPKTKLQNITYTNKLIEAQKKYGSRFIECGRCHDFYGNKESHEC